MTLRLRIWISRSSGMTLALRAVSERSGLCYVMKGGKLKIPEDLTASPYAATVTPL